MFDLFSQISTETRNRMHRIFIKDDGSEVGVADVKATNARTEMRYACPMCKTPLQKYGKRVVSNSVVMQRLVCPICRKEGRSPHNFFTDISN
jgi:uncharacterized protein with PIN domain